MKDFIKRNPKVLGIVAAAVAGGVAYAMGLPFQQVFDTIMNFVAPLR